MTMMPIIESEMAFGPYPSGFCFHIENSACYKSIQDGVRMAEFLLLRQKEGSPPAVWVVEAKSSSPRPQTEPNFDEFIDDVRAKLTNGFLLCMATCLRRHPNARDELPEPFKGLGLETTQFRFVLVIKGHHLDWLAPLQSALSQALKPVVKTWALPALSVAVINDIMAQEHGLILTPDALAGCA